MQVSNCDWPHENQQFNQTSHILHKHTQLTINIKWIQVHNSKCMLINCGYLHSGMDGWMLLENRELSRTLLVLLLMGRGLNQRSCSCHYFGTAQEKLTLVSLWRKTAELELNTLLPAPRNVFMLQTEANRFVSPILSLCTLAHNKCTYLWLSSACGKQEARNQTCFYFNGDMFTDCCWVVESIEDSSD